MASASSILDGIVENLSAPSALGRDNVSVHYKVLETSTACCMVVGFQALNDPVITMGSDRQRTWTFMLEGYVRERPSPCQSMLGIHSFTQKVVDSLESDDTIQGEIAGILNITVERVPNEALEVSGNIWFPIPMTVSMLEYP